MLFILWLHSNCDQQKMCRRMVAWQRETNNITSNHGGRNIFLPPCSNYGWVIWSSAKNRCHACMYMARGGGGVRPPPSPLPPVADRHILSYLNRGITANVIILCTTCSSFIRCLNYYYIMYTYCKYFLYILLYILNTYSVEYNNVLIWTSWETSTLY